MHISVIAAPSVAKTRRLIVGADHERATSVAAARARRSPATRPRRAAASICVASRPLTRIT